MSTAVTAEDVAASLPPLTDEQVARLAWLLSTTHQGVADRCAD